VKKAATTMTMAEMSLENALDLDMNMLALALVTPQVCNQETPWMVRQPPLESQPARSAAASRGKVQPKARQARKRPSEPSTWCKAPQTSRKRGRREVAETSSSVPITRRPADEQVTNNALSDAETFTLGLTAYATSDVVNAMVDAFDDVLSDQVLQNDNSVRARFSLRITRNLLVLRLKRILGTESTQNGVSLEDITKHVFEMLEGFGIGMQ
jgi:hypothetical protein